MGPYFCTSLLVYNYSHFTQQKTLTCDLFETLPWLQKPHNFHFTFEGRKISSYHTCSVNLHLEGEHKLSTLTFLSLEAISYARMLQSLKISCLLLYFLIFLLKLISIIQMRIQQLIKQNHYEIWLKMWFNSNSGPANLLLWKIMIE